MWAEGTSGRSESVEEMAIKAFLAGRGEACLSYLHSFCNFFLHRAV